MSVKNFGLYNVYNPGKMLASSVPEIQRETMIFSKFRAAGKGVFFRYFF